MKNQAKLFFAKVLIFFSIIFIGIGIFLTFFCDEKVFHPINDVTFFSGKRDNISVTTTSSDEQNDYDYNLLNNSNPTTNLNQNDFYNNSSDSTLTTKELNLQLRTNIQDNYGVVVKYGDETSDYSVGGMNTSVIENDEESRDALVNLNLALALYPSGFFDEMKNKGYSLTFYLVKRYSKDNVTGVTDSTYNDVTISVATDYDFIDTFHHEVYHYIEKYISSLGASFVSWGTLNPAGFNYGVIDSTYSYSINYSEDAFFVNSYAMTDQYEDRASTFEYMMKSNKASCLNYGKTVWLKARTMCEQIDYFFSTVSPDVTEYWERHIY